MPPACATLVSSPAVAFSDRFKGHPDAVSSMIAVRSVIPLPLLASPPLSSSFFPCRPQLNLPVKRATM